MKLLLDSIRLDWLSGGVAEWLAEKSDHAQACEKQKKIKRVA